MTKPYSLDLRERVVARILAGDTIREISDVFGLSNSCVVKWGQRFRLTGSVAPAKMGGYCSKILIGDTRNWLLQRIETGDFTLRGLVVELAERGVSADYKTVWKFVHAEGKSYKKNSPGQRTKPSGRGPPPSPLEELPRRN